MINKELNRREFLKSSAATSAGLVIGFYVPGLKSGSLLAGFAQAQAAEHAAPKIDFEQPNAFIKIAPDGKVTLVINKLEMGQGVYTSMAQLIAEELECDWKTIESVSAPVAPVYNHMFFSVMQMTGGSTALNSTWKQYRTVGAMAREMLISAAAQEWKVEAKDCHAKNGFIYGSGGKKLSFGELAAKAAALPVPQNVKLKPHKDFKFIGKSVQRVDAAAKSHGTALYGLDVRLPGMLYAVIARPPVPGAKLKSVSSSDAKGVRSVVDVVKMENAVAVLAKNTWSARKGRDLLQIKWDIPEAAKVSTDKMFEEYKVLATKPGVSAKKSGDAAEGLTHAKQKFLAEYEFPYLAHACMEPLNCTINYDGKTCEMWAGFQMPTSDRAAAANILGLEPEKVKMNTTFAGGSFGRRASKTSDYAVEAAELAKKVKKPLKIVWTREDDTKGGSYRPQYVHRVEAGVDGKGHISGWKHAIVGQSVVAHSPLEKMMIHGGIDPTVVEGVSDTHYAIENMSVDLHLTDNPITTLWWRSVGHTHTAFAMETAIDELAHMAKKDAIAFRKNLLKKSPRHMAVLDLLEKHGGTKSALPKGHAWGVAIHESFNSVVGHVAHISLDGGQVKVHKVVSAVHCGTVVNPDSARMQVEGAIAMGLSALFYGKISVKDGIVQQSNFSDYPVLRLPDMPKVEVHFVKSQDPPTGLGEPGLPPIAPAVVNALFKLTKQRIRKMPLQGQTLVAAKS